MNHKRTLLVPALALLALALAGCATTEQPAPTPATDKIGEIIAKYAKSASASLQALSENEGGTRTILRESKVTSQIEPIAQARPIAAYGIPITKEGAAPAPVSIKAAPATVAPAAVVTPMVRIADRVTYGAGSVTIGSSERSTIPAGLERPITLADITDDVEGLLERISRQVGWVRLPSTGIRISRQPLTVNAVNRPAIEVIRELSGALGRSAEIVVTPGNRTMSVQFPTH